jgi:small subunit ribosomal protein S13
MRINGITIPDNKAIQYSLMYIRGIGKYRATEICKNLHIPNNLKTCDLTEEQIGNIDNYISKYIVVGDDLSRITITNIKNKIDLGGFSGRKLKNGLPRYGSGRSAGKTARKLLGTRKKGGNK